MAKMLMDNVLCQGGMCKNWGLSARKDGVSNDGSGGPGNDSQVMPLKGVPETQNDQEVFTNEAGCSLSPAACCLLPVPGYFDLLLPE